MTTFQGNKQIWILTWFVKRQNIAGLCQQTFQFSWSKEKHDHEKLNSLAELAQKFKFLHNSCMGKWFYETVLQGLYLIQVLIISFLPKKLEFCISGKKTEFEKKFHFDWRLVFHKFSFPEFVLNNIKVSFVDWNIMHEEQKKGKIWRLTVKPRSQIAKSNIHTRLGK